MKHASLYLTAALLAGCASVPNIGGDRIDILAVAPDAPDAWAAAGVTGDAPAGDWLGSFNDPTMVDLVKDALKNNPTIASRVAAVEAARQQARATYGRTLPSADVSFSTGGTRNVFEDPLTGDPESVDDSVFGLGLDASWEADLWGRLRAGVRAADADFQATAADLASAELSLAAQTANAWISLNEALSQERVAVQTFEARDRIVVLTERRFSRGLTNALDVRTARSALAGAEAQIALSRQISGEAARALETLLGRYPGNLIEAAAELPTLEPISPGGNPALLLSRRPDIAAAEQRVSAAGLRAEQARLALLPSLRLTASLSTSDDEIANAFDPSYIAGRAIASLAQPVFNGGALAAQRDAAIAQAEQAVANYAATALTAWREVENAIAADALLAQQEDAQARSLEEAVFAEELADRQYQNGLISIFNLIDAQTRRLNAESALVTARANRAGNRVNYHLALGGGLPPSVAQSDFFNDPTDPTLDAAAARPELTP